MRNRRCIKLLLLSVAMSSHSGSLAQQDSSYVPGRPVQFHSYSNGRPYNQQTAAPSFTESTMPPMAPSSIQSSMPPVAPAPHIVPSPSTTAPLQTRDNPPSSAEGGLKGKLNKVAPMLKQAAGSMLPYVPYAGQYAPAINSVQNTGTVPLETVPPNNFGAPAQQYNDGSRQTNPNEVDTRSLPPAPPLPSGDDATIYMLPGLENFARSLPDSPRTNGTNRVNVNGTTFKVRG